MSLGLLLAGCGGSSETGAHDDTLIVLDHSIGGVALGERRSEVERRLGQGFVLEAEDQKPPEPSVHSEDVLYAKHGLEVWYVSRSGTAVSRRRGRVSILLTHSPRFRTPEGVHVGSPVAALRRLEGLNCGNLPDLDCPARSNAASPIARSWIARPVESNAVISSSDSRPGAVPASTAPRSVTSSRPSTPAPTACASSPLWLACSQVGQISR